MAEPTTPVFPAGNEITSAEPASVLSPADTSSIQNEAQQDYQSAIGRGNAMSQRAQPAEPAQPPSSVTNLPESGPNKIGGPFAQSPTAGRSLREAQPPPSVTDLPPGSPKPAPPAAAPAKPAPPAAPEKEPSVWGWLSDWVKGTGQEAGYGLMRGEAELGQGLARLGASSVDALATNLKDALTDQTHLPGQKAPPRVKGAENVEANFEKNVIQPAIQSWTPKRGSYIGDDGTGPLAQAVGGAAESVPLMVTGGLGLTSMMYNTFTDSYHEAVKDGQTGAQAALTATLDSAALGLNMRLLGKDWAGKAIPDVPAWIRRGLAGIAGGDLVNMGAAFAKKMALEAAGNDAAARKIDVTAPARDPIQAGENAMFGILGSKHPEKTAKEPEPPQPPPSATRVPEPVKPAQPPAAATTPPPAPPSTVPDQPSGESAKQLHAQVMDTKRSDTPRNGVLITPESQQHLDSLPADHRDAAPVRGYISQARAQGRTVQLPQGELVLKNKKIATQVKGQLGAGVDPQTVIGRVTGAGEGKFPDQTAIVQGREPVSGQVTTEKAVRPEDVGPARKEILTQGKVPVVMTPEGAVQERAMGMRQEAEEAQEKPAQPAETAPPPVEVPEKIAAPEPAGEAAPEPKEPETPQEGMYRTDSGKEVPVHLAGEGAAGKLKVRPLDENGEPQAPVEVPAERVRTGGKAPEATEAPVSETSKGMSALNQLPAALASHERAETATGRRKNPASLRERQDNASAFAAVLRQAATEAAAKGSAPEPAIRRAAEASRRAIGLTNKSKEATEKGQGTGHAKVTALVKAMHEAARALLGHPAVTAAKEPAREITKEAVKQLAQQQKEKPEELRTMARLPMEKLTEEQPVEEPKIAEIARAVSKGNTRLTIADLNNKHEVPPRDFARVAAAVRAKMAEGKKAKAVEAAKTEATPVEKARTNVLAAKYLKAETPEEAAAARDLLTDHLKAVAARLGHPPDTTHADVDTMLEYLRKQREQPEGEEPPETHTFERPEEGFSVVSRPAESPADIETQFVKSGRWHRETAKLAGDMEAAAMKMGESPLWAQMRKLRDTGQSLSSHALMDELAKGAKGAVKDLIQHIRAKLPDVPAFTQTEVINAKDLSGMGPTVYGLFNASRTAEGPNSSMQIQVADRPSAYKLTWSIMHEAQHAGMMDEYYEHPHGQFRSQLDNAWRIFARRLAKKYGNRQVLDTIEHFRPTAGAARPDLPAGMEHLYGLSHPLEMAAEAESNPKFMQEMIESEKYASPDENLPPPVHGLPALLSHVIKAIADFFGVEPKLLAHVFDISKRMSEEQQTNQPELYRPDAYLHMDQRQNPSFKQALTQARIAREGATDVAAAHAAATEEEERGQLMEAPKPIKASGEIRAVLGDEATGSARETAHALASRSIDLARHGVYDLKTEGQIFRDGKDAFGHDDDTNPINQERQVGWDKNKIMHQMRSLYNPTARAWMYLGSRDNIAVSKLLADSSLWGIDARNEERPIAGSKISPRQDEFYRRYDKLSDAAKTVYKGAIDSSRAARGVERRAVVDTALKGFDIDVSPEQKALLYGARGKGAFERLIKEGGLVDVGDKNEKLRGALKDWIGHDIEGPYVHLGRQGEYVVTAHPEGTREFGSNQDAARAFVAQTAEMSPHSKGKMEFRGGQWVVDYKVQHTSMHKTRAEAENFQAKLKAAGYESPPVSQKVYDREAAQALTPAMQELMTSAIHKIERAGNDEGTKALIESLHSTYLQMQAARSAYAGSRLMRKGFGGVKAKDMRQNFAEHASSSTWHTASMATLFRQAEAMSRLRTMAKDPDIDQATAYKRGEVVRELGKRAAREASVNRGGATNRRMAQLGFLAFLTSPSHAAMWLTQNYSTGIPWAAASYGWGRSIAAFHKGMGHVASTALRQAVMEQFSKHAAPDEIQAAIERTIAKDPRLGKWAPAIRELYERGVISHGYSNELGALGQGQHPVSIRVMDWARVFPAMADAFNRTSTALAGLELTGGDLRKTADMVEAIHADYSAQNKPRAFQALSRVPGGTSLTMFKTYTQAMAHLVYGSAVEAIKGVNPKGSPEQRAKSWVAAKTLAGVMVGNALFAGVYGALGLEPARLLVYAYNKIFGEEGEVWDMKNAIHHFLVDHLGKTAGDALARGPIAQMLGIDVSNRMGLANMFFHDPPDLLTTDKDAWKQFFWNETPPPLQWLANAATGMAGHIQNGEYMQAIASAMPVKIIQDSLKALQQVNGAGGNAPVSTLDAFKQTMGFKPASVADQQEQKGVRTEISKAQGLVRRSIIRQVLAAAAGSPELDVAVARWKAFNERNPGAALSTREIKEEAERQAKEQAGVSKNVRANEAADFSGR